MLRVSRALDNAGSRSSLSLDVATMEQKMSIQDEAISHVKLAQEWNQLLTNIRAIPKIEFEDFLRPSSCSNLFKHLPNSGCIIVINVDQHFSGCDALALVSGSNAPLHIPLPNFSYAKAADLHKQLETHLHSANLRMRGCELDIRALHKVM
jgi:hypothetical protein